MTARILEAQIFPMQFFGASEWHIRMERLFLEFANYRKEILRMRESVVRRAGDSSALGANLPS